MQSIIQLEQNQHSKILPTMCAVARILVHSCVCVNVQCITTHKALF
jgi:hypothetical protein